MTGILSGNTMFFFRFLASYSVSDFNYKHSNEMCVLLWIFTYFWSSVLYVMEQKFTGESKYDLNFIIIPSADIWFSYYKRGLCGLSRDRRKGLQERPAAHCQTDDCSLVSVVTLHNLYSAWLPGHLCFDVFSFSAQGWHKTHSSPTCSDSASFDCRLISDIAGDLPVHGLVELCVYAQ